jgi:hypothetical protein
MRDPEFLGALKQIFHIVMSVGLSPVLHQQLTIFYTPTTTAWIQTKIPVYVFFI